MSTTNHNPKAKGYYRDRQILQTIEAYRALDTEHIQTLFFGDIESGQRKAQERLLKLYRAGRLKRHRTDTELFCYYIDDPPKLLQHHLDLNWIRIWLETSLPSWEKIDSFTYEQKYKDLRTDAFVAIKNTVSGQFRFLFVEMDRAFNPFDKVPKYCQLYEKEGYKDWWWVRLTDHFPPVLTVTTDYKRMEHIKKAITQQNSAGLDFRVELLDEVKRQVKKKCSVTHGPTG